MQVLEELRDYLNSGDPEARKWFLVRQSYLPFILTLCYCLMCVHGPNLMRNRKPWNLQKIMIIFNFSIVLAYTVSLCLIAYYLRLISWKHFCIRGRIVKGEPTYKLMTIAWIVYLLKYIEYMDTFFFILRKKENQVTFLHVFHHSSVPLIGWLLLRTERNGMQSVPVILNILVHVVMYTYYGLAAMGPTMRKYLWWKKHLTQLQIAQFILMLFFGTVIAPMYGCVVISSSYFLYITFAPIFLLLFYRFYKTSFKPTTLTTKME